MKDRAPTYFLNENFDNKLNSYVDKLLSDGEELFQDEFQKLPEFISEANVDQSDRSDHELRRSPKELYLLEAISFKLYDRMNRDAFNKAKNTLIIMPDCLSMHNDNCLKSDEPFGNICQLCVSECQAADITALGEKYGIETVFSKKKLSDQITHYTDRSGSLAVIGIACLMMLARGMRVAGEISIPTRGVLLSYTGCEHWNDEPFASAFPLEQLKLILEEKYGKCD